MGRLRPALAVLTALAASMIAVVPLASGAGAATGCKVAYTKSDWGAGFTSNITVTNLGDAWTSWTLKYSYAGNQTLTNGWSAKWSQSGKDVTVANEGWNGPVATNGTVTFGGQFTYSGTNVDPTAFTVNGVACNGVTPTPTVTPTVTPTTPSGAAPKLKVAGNKLVDEAGSPVILRGVNRSSGEYACIQDNGLWDGPMGDDTVKAMTTWKIKAVRVPLNEDCWLGQSWVNPAYSGQNYQKSIKDYVTILEANGIVPILDLHWNSGTWTGQGTHCATSHAECQKPMPDMQYAPQFWKEVATAFKADLSVVFDLFNEPFPNFLGTMSYDQSWDCWKDGGSACTGLTYEAAGLQDLVDAVRGTGAKNVVLASGISYSNDLSGWLTHRPTDPAGNLAASWHSYNFNYCNTATCWDSTIAPVAAAVPVVVAEMGENDCGHSYIDTLMNWLDGKGISYLGWTWNTWNCNSGPALISNLDGTPTSYGIGFRDHLRAVS
jgi:endoglucanase